MRNLLILLAVFPLLANAQNEPIEIHLNSGEVLYTNYVYIYSSFNSGVRINSRKGEKISIRDVDFIQGFDKERNFRYFTTIGYNGTVWAERSFASERVKIYSTSRFDFEYSAKAGDVYQLDDGPIRDIKYRNLKEDLSDYQQSMDYLKKANGIRTTQAVLWTASVGLFIGGIVQMVGGPLEDPEESLDIPPMFYLAAGVNLAAWVLEIPKKNRFRKALQVYE
jgi:hypothetical protein